MGWRPPVYSTQCLFRTGMPDTRVLLSYRCTSADRYPHDAARPRPGRTGPPSAEPSGCGSRRRIRHQHRRLLAKQISPLRYRRSAIASEFFVIARRQHRGVCRVRGFAGRQQAAKDPHQAGGEQPPKPPPEDNRSEPVRHGGQCRVTGPAGTGNPAFAPQRVLSAA
jgi:hypothetical protein